jgi:(2Fe-2S) ferredoxin
MPKFTHHIFVCCNQRSPDHPRGCCDPEGAERLRQKFKVELERRGISGLVRANRSGCLDQCELGPTVVIYPQAIWYWRVQTSDVQRIIDLTVLGGRTLEDLQIPDALLNAKVPLSAAGGEAESETNRNRT